MYSQCDTTYNDHEHPLCALPFEPIRHFRTPSYCSLHQKDVDFEDKIQKPRSPFNKIAKFLSKPLDKSRRLSPRFFKNKTEKQRDPTPAFVRASLPANFYGSRPVSDPFSDTVSNPFSSTSSIMSYSPPFSSATTAISIDATEQESESRPIDPVRIRTLSSVIRTPIVTGTDDILKSINRRSCAGIIISGSIRSNSSNKTLVRSDTITTYSTAREELLSTTTSSSLSSSISTSSLLDVGSIANLEQRRNGENEGIFGCDPDYEYECSSTTESEEDEEQEEPHERRGKTMFKSHNTTPELRNRRGFFSMLG